MRHCTPNQTGQPEYSGMFLQWAITIGYCLNELKRNCIEKYTKRNCTLYGKEYQPTPRQKTEVFSLRLFADRPFRECVRFGPASFCRVTPLFFFPIAPIKTGQQGKKTNCIKNQIEILNQVNFLHQKSYGSAAPGKRTASKNKIHLPMTYQIGKEF